MKKLLLLSFVLVGIVSCSKKKECLSHKSDEVWLILEDSNGVNLLNTLHQDLPIVNLLGPTAFVSHFERVNAYDGNDTQISWKVNLNKLSSNSQYQVITESDTFMLEPKWALQDSDCEYKDYTGRKLDWLKFEDSTYYHPGILKYVVS